MAKPYLHCHRRFKNGKDHCYWSIAEKERTRQGWVQRPLLYLGEINDSQREVWTMVIEVFAPVREQTHEGWTASMPLYDDLGYVQQSREEMEVLFSFLAERYERRSVLVSSNLVFFKVGPDLQGPDDNDGGGGSAGASGHHPGIRR